MSTLSQFSGGRIKSIQRGIITLSTSTATATLTTAVDTTKSILYHLGVTSNGLVSYTTPISGAFAATTIQIGLELTNSTTITATASVASITGATASVARYGSVSWQLVEYY